jgi:predicted nucleotidyltransferase
MRTSPPPLIPILRSRVQAELLAFVLGDPTGEWSLTELADALGSSAATVGREVERAAQAGLVRVAEVGRTKLVSAETSSEYFAPLARLLLLSFGPRQRLAETLSGVSGIEEAYLFGSWADRYMGNEGAAPKDIDVLVVGTPDRADVYAVIEPLESELGRPIQATFRTRQQWDDPTDPFVTTVRSRPMVVLFRDDGQDS